MSEAFIYTPIAVFLVLVIVTLLARPKMFVDQDGELKEK